MPRAVRRLRSIGRLDRQQRTQQADAARFAQGGHAGEAVRPAVAQHAHRQRFHLIRRVMTEQQMQDAGFRAGPVKSLVAHDPRPLGQRGTVCQV